MKLTVTDHSMDPPEVVATFTLAPDGRAVCDNPDYLALYEMTGVVEPGTLVDIYPANGARFLRAVPAYLRGFVFAELEE